LVGALAPPDGLDSAADFSLEASFSADAPPEGLLAFSSVAAPRELPPLSGSSVASLPPDSFAALSPLVVVEVFVLDVEVEVVCAAAFSALVSFGGVISGVLFGIATEALLPPPHAASVAASNNASASASALAFNDLPPASRAVPSAYRRWGSR
jgi:hypothetical protein